MNKLLKTFFKIRNGWSWYCSKLILSSLFSLLILTNTNLLWLVFLWRSIGGALQGPKTKTKQLEKLQTNDESSELFKLLMHLEIYLQLFQVQLGG